MTQTTNADVVVVGAGFAGLTAARELEITLTARNKEKGTAIPMCGVPYHAAEGYIARLIQKGYDKPPYGA